ncbi:hypothetical protein [Streptococcus ruminantium]|uniref:hypothetical protein n=1 Tax=Streptococcus ruminantium TaxID=1917441 RepID=UPI0012DE56CE|nr:hypothetical protein [Streptococcus ruminantium]
MRRKACEFFKKYWNIFIIGIGVLYIGFSFFCPWFQNVIFLNGRGLLPLSFVILTLYWFLDGKVRIWNNSEMDENYKKSTNFLFSVILSIGTLVVGIYTYCLSEPIQEISSFYTGGFLSFLISFMIVVGLITPFQKAHLEYKYQKIDKNFLLKVWNYYSFKDKGMSNFEIYSSNISSITLDEIKTVSDNLKQGSGELEYLNDCLDIPKYRESYEISLNNILVFFVKFIGSATLLSTISSFITKEGKQIKDNFIQSLSEQSLLTIISMFVFLILLIFFIFLFYYEFSFHQKRQQIEVLLPKMIKKLLNEVEVSEVADDTV